MATWAASPQPSEAEPVVLHGETLREVVHLSAGGDSIRLHLSNAYGKTPLEVAAVHVASSAGEASTLAGSDRAVLGALADPSHPARIAPAFDSGDHLHPNDAGYQAMADAIDLALLALE